MDLRNIIIFLAALLNLFFGVSIFFKGREKLINKIYSLVAFSVFYWGITMVIYRYVDTVEFSVLWCKILYTAPIFIVSSFLYFTLIFPYGQIKKIVSYPAFIAAFIFLVLSLFTNTIIKDVVLRPGQEKLIVFGKLYLLYSFYISGFFLWSYINLYIKRKESVGITRAQINYVLIGSFVASFTGMITNLLMPTFGFFELNWAGQILSLFMVIFIAYAIIRHRLMDIKMVFRKSSVYISSLLTIIASAFLLRYLLNLIAPELTIWIDSLVIIIAILTYPRLKDYFYSLANKYFFSSLYEPQKVIGVLSENLRLTLEVDRIYDYIHNALNESLHPKAFGILSYDDKSDTYYVKYNEGFETGNIKVFAGNQELNKIFVEQNKTIIVEEVREHYYNNKTKETIDLLIGLKVEILVPLNVKDRIVGLIALGAKESGDMYNDDDIRMLEIVGSQSAIAIENALLYEETKNFNIKLEQEVEKATIELRSANVKLKKLDEAKSEFISIASHQLRTPLTVIKGYISMMLEGNFGELTTGERDSLDKVYDSNERLIQLVENLLNISRIESGRLQYNFEFMHIEEVVDSVVEELEGMAKKKGLKFMYKKPKKMLPRTLIDDEKIRQVVLNLIDNAIKYTKKGSITVSLKEKDKKLEFCVSDSGMGISQEDLPGLFKKFSRGTGTSLIHTEGTGLGLYVADQMISSHQGKVWAESKGEGKGSKFYFQLPIKKK